MLSPQSFAKHLLPPAVVKLLIGWKIAVMTEWWSLGCTIRKHLFLRRILCAFPALHIGCGDVRLPGCVNVDLRPTRATDITEDCVTLTSIPSGSVRTVYANAFLEHVFLEQRLPCLRSIHRVLQDGGYTVITAIPDFEQIARAYLQKKPGIISPMFDLMNVYRYTHGEPEGAINWMAQLHKSLFDPQTLIALLQESGFPTMCLFSYSYRSEPVAISLGFIAYKTHKKMTWTKDRICSRLGPLSSDVNFRSINIIKCFRG